MVRPPYPVVVRLCVYASERWAEIDAEYHALPIPLLRQKPHRFANLIYAWCIERVQHDKIDEWLQELEELLPWQDASSEAAIDAESASFFDMMNKKG